MAYRKGGKTWMYMFAGWGKEEGESWIGGNRGKVKQGKMIEGRVRCSWKANTDAFMLGYGKGGNTDVHIYYIYKLSFNHKQANKSCLHNIKIHIIFPLCSL